MDKAKRRKALTADTASFVQLIGAIQASQQFEAIQSLQGPYLKSTFQ